VALARQAEEVEVVVEVKDQAEEALEVALIMAAHTKEVLTNTLTHLFAKRIGIARLGASANLMVSCIGIAQISTIAAQRVTSLQRKNLASMKGIAVTV